MELTRGRRPILTRIAAPRADRPPLQGRPVSGWAFAGFAVTSFGGPLALAALYAPAIVADASLSAGLTMIAAAAVFVVPLAIWLRYARHVNTGGGLYSFTQAAAGHRVALAQAGLWITSYLLYLVYTSAQIVYGILPAVFPGIGRYQAGLEVAIPVALAGMMIAGRRAALIATGALAGGQLVITAALSAVAVAHLGAPAESFTGSAPAGALAAATGQTALLYICGSLPLFLGGEVANPRRSVRRGLVAAYLASAAAATAAVFPLWAAPAFTRTPIPGVSLAQQFAGRGFAIVVGVGVAASVAGVMIAEYLALSRLVHAVTSRSQRAVTVALGAVLAGSAPLTLIDPERIYEDLLKPSLVALWLSQLIVFAAYPRFARRHGGRAVPAWALAAGAAAFALYGLWSTLHHSLT